MSKADFLVTGGAGFIGSNAVRFLLSRGHSVRVLDDLSTGREENLFDVREKIEFLRGSICDLPTCRAAVDGVRYVLHMAAIPSVPRSVEDPVTTSQVNIMGTVNMLVAARDAGVDRFVHSSSSSVYGDLPTLPKREDMMPCPRSPYALAKMATEHFCRLFWELYGLKTFCLRYFNVFGPRQNPKSQYAAVVPLFIDRMRRGERPTVYGDGEQTRDFTYVDNVIEANLACCSAPADAVGQVFNVGCGTRLTVNQLGRAIAAALGCSFEPEYAPPRPGDVRDSQADVTKAKRLLGWEPRVGVEEGLRRTVEWFVKQP